MAIIDEQQHQSKDPPPARAILRESEELKNLLEDGLRRLENNETFAVNDFQKGVVRALIDLFSHGQRACKRSNGASIEHWRRGISPRRCRNKKRTRYFNRAADVDP